MLGVELLAGVVDGLLEDEAVIVLDGAGDRVAVLVEDGATERDGAGVGDSPLELEGSALRLGKGLFEGEEDFEAGLLADAGRV